MAKSQDELFELIQKMTVSEKGYFRKHYSSQSSGQNNYMRLFDVYEKLNEFDDSQIKKNLEGETFLKHLSRVKNYLYHQLLKGLNAYHAEKSIDHKLQQMIREVELLFYKTLTQQAQKVLQRAKKQAYEYERFKVVLELLDWEKKLINSTLYAAHGSEEMERLHKEEKLILKTLNEEADSWYKLVQCNVHLKMQGFRSPKSKEHIEGVLNDPLLASDSNSLSTKARLGLYDALAYYYEAQVDYGRSYVFRKKIYQIWREQHGNHQKYFARQEVSFLNHYMVACQYSYQFEELDELLKYAKQLPEELGSYANEEIRQVLFQSIFYIESNMLCSGGRYQEGLEMVEREQKQLDYYLPKLNKIFQSGFLYNLAHMHFGAQNYDRALDYVNELLDLKSDPRQFYFNMAASMFSIIVHFELGNDEILSSLVRSTKRKIKDREHRKKGETLLLNFFKKVPSFITFDTVMIAELTKLKHDLTRVLEDPYEKRAIDYFNYLGWIESKLTGVTFQRIAIKQFETAQEELSKEVTELMKVA